MAPSKKVVSIVESFEDHFLQEQIAKMMAIVEAFVQQATSENRALEEARAEFAAKIAKLQQEKQYLKDVRSL